MNTMSKPAGFIGASTIAIFAVIGSIAAYICISTAAPMIIGSFLNHMQNVTAVEKIDVAAERVYQNKYYKDVCPGYFSASFITKKIGLNELAWCEAYRDRM